MSIIQSVKNVFKKSVIEVISMKDLVEKLDWAKGEVQDTKDALTGLQFRLQHGILVMEDIQEEATKVIAHHQDILDKAKSRHLEFTGQVGQVENAIKLVTEIHKEDVTNGDNNDRN